jgi:hypothetical protein
MTVAAKVCATFGGWAVIAVFCSTAAAQPLVVRCEGPFGRNATRADVIKAYGADAVDQVLDGPEGAKLKATVLYPKDPKRRLEIIWNDEKARRRPTIRITQQSTWATASGVRLGMALTEIERLNGKPYKLYGFEWDYGGRTSNWMGGNLGKPQPGGCALTLALGFDFDKAPKAMTDKVSGDSEFLSTKPAKRALKPAVYEITIGYGKMSERLAAR